MDNVCPMENAKQLADALGRAEIAQRLGVGATAVSNAVVRGAFPSSWYAVIRAMAKARGIDCPMKCFAWRAARPGRADAA